MESYVARTGTPHEKPMTFEIGAKAMSEKLDSTRPEAYYANEKDPLHAAFVAKAALHSGISARPAMGEEAKRVYEGLLERPRTGKSLAYIHVPFCETRCLYCLFYQNPYKPEDSAAFTDRLIRELQMNADTAARKSAPVQAVFFGGGTPTALEAADLKRILQALPEYLPLSNDCEITIEGRIHNFGDEKIEAALEGGANRFSLGVQSFNSQVRQSMLRVDDRDTVIRRLEKLVSYDEAAVVADLIYGFPHQSMDVWVDDLATACSLDLDGVDCYQLNVFEKAPMTKYVANGKLPAPADTAVKADMFAMSVDYFTKAQWKRISNNHWRRTSRERNIYNEFGKSACDCLAFGCGAGGRLHGSSFMLNRSLEEWSREIDVGQKPVWVLTEPGPNWRLLRTVSSNMESGAVNLEAIGRQFGVPVAALCEPIVSQWVHAGLLERVGPWLVQTVAGQFWHVTLAQLLIEWLDKKLSPQTAAQRHGPHGGPMAGTHIHSLAKHPEGHPGGHPGARG